MSKKEETRVQDALGEMEARGADEKQAELLKENKLGTMPVGKLLINMSLPIIVSMLVQALYNVVDSMFVARLGEEALAAVGLIFPVQNLMIAVSVGTGVGISSLLGRRLGEGNAEAANRVAVNGLFLTVLSWLAFAVFGLVGTNAFLSAFAGGDASPAMVEMASEYMVIVTIGSFGLFMSITLERLLNATGRTVYSMVSQIAGAVTNIILDPIMIFGLLGFPAMGVAGAALATIIGQYVGMAIGIIANVKKNHEIHIRLRGFRPEGRSIKNIYQVGLPSIIMQSIGSVMTFCMNLILVGFGTTPVSVFIIYFTLQSFVFMPVLGLNNGMVPIIAFNYGARKLSRITRTIKLALVIAASIMCFGTVLFWVAPGALLSLFNAGPEMLEIGTQALRIISLCFPLAAVSIVFTGVFQATAQGVYSLIMSVVRQLVFLIPIAWLLARLRGLHALWFAFPIAEAMCILCALWFFKRLWNGKLKNLETAPM